MKHALIAATVALLTSGSASAIESSIQIELGATTDFEQRIVNYDCATETPLQARYINAAPNFLALVTVPDQTEQLVFASVISGSGARYASGQWIWWTQGSDASLYDATLGEDAEPVLSCSEIINTP